MSTSSNSEIRKLLAAAIKEKRAGDVLTRVQHSQSQATNVETRSA